MATSKRAELASLIRKKVCGPGIDRLRCLLMLRVIQVEPGRIRLTKDALTRVLKAADIRFHWYATLDELITPLGILIRTL